MTTLLLKNRPKENNTSHKHPGTKSTQPLIDQATSPDQAFEGIWRSPNGSLYMCNGTCFICVSIHSGQFQGWLNKVAIKDIHKAGNHWVGQQAFRNSYSGNIQEWVDIRLEPQQDKIIKYFPAHLPPAILVNGYIEVYYKIR